MDAGEAIGYAMHTTEAAFQFGHIMAGLNAGLYAALVQHSEEGATPAQLAKELGYVEEYVRVWCEYGYSIRVLDAAGNGRFCLSEGFRFWLGPASPMNVAAILGVTQLAVREQFELPEFLRTGAVRSYLDHGEEFSRLTAGATEGFVGMLMNQVYEKQPAVALKLEEGGRLLELGCGQGRLLIALAKRFPPATFVGTDLDSQAIAAAQAAVQAQGLADRIELRAVAAESLGYREEFDLVSLVFTMHELPERIRPQGVVNACRALRPGGLLISTDFHYPSRLEDFRKPEYSTALRDQAGEVVWGNRHLSQEQLGELLVASGFQRSEFQVIESPLIPAPFLTTLAYK